MSELVLVRRLNRALEAAWRGGLLPVPVLEPAALQKAALQGRPETAFGADTAWREPLDRLCEAIVAEADLNQLGRSMAYGQIVMALRSRIRAAEIWSRAPQKTEPGLPAPIIILGQMRSGTTRLQRLLACDPRLAFTRTFESLQPVPRHGRRLQTRMILSLLRRLNPELARIHPSHATAPEEEFGLFSFSMGSAQFEAQWRVPSFSRWWEAADCSQMYREFSALLRTIAAARRPSDGRRWVIKAPQFLQDLPTVIRAFPGAHYLWLQRDPGEIVASSASLVWNQMRIQSDSADPEWVGPEWLRKTRLRHEVGLSSLGTDFATPPLLIGYEAMNRDWQSEIRAVYAHIGLELTPDVESRMSDYIRGARSHHGHAYSLEAFGLSRTEVDSAFEAVDQVRQVRAIIAPAA